MDSSAQLALKTEGKRNCWKGKNIFLILSPLNVSQCCQQIWEWDEYSKPDGSDSALSTLCWCKWYKLFHCVKLSYSDLHQYDSEHLSKVTIVASFFSQKLAAKETEPLQRQLRVKLTYFRSASTLKFNSCCHKEEVSCLLLNHASSPQASSPPSLPFSDAGEMLHESSLPSGITTQPLLKTSLGTLPLETVAISLWIDWILFKIRFCLPYSRKALINSGEVKELHAV